MKNTLTKMLGGLATVAALTTVVYAADLPQGRVETFVGNKYSTLDTKVFGPIVKDKITYFGRNITTWNYDSKTHSPFSFIDLSLNIGKGFTLVNETQFIDGEKGVFVTPRFGFEYFGTVSPISTNLTLYTISTANVPTHYEPTLNGESVVTLTWSPPLRKDGKLNGFLQVEALTNYGGKGINFASQNFRAGVATKKVEAGIGVNLSEVPSADKTFSYTVGPFLSWKF